MADQNSDWSTKANDALSICLVTPNSGCVNTIHKFHPKFSYTIFGDEESIFGYQNLHISLRYHASSLLPHLQVSYGKKFRPIGETNATDIEGTLNDFLPQIAFNKLSAFETNINGIAKDWRPPGELLTSLSAGNDSYEVWKGNLTDKAVQQTIKRIQILIPLFIEGGQAINLSDPMWSLQRWTVFFLYKKTATPNTTIEHQYVFMGYSTVYRYFHYPLSASPTTTPKISRPHPPAPSDFQFPDPNKSDLPCRSRISQFLILPPFQGGGVGSRFYEVIFEYYLNHPQTVEITVEDPNEAFDDMRDLNDLKRLRTMPEFANLRINTQVTIRSKGRMPTGKIVDLDAIENLRNKMKIAPRQFMRLVEMQLLSLIPTYVRMSLLYEKQQGTPAELKAVKHEYHLWKLFVKQRLYRHNKDTLMQLDRTERIDKLDDTMGSVETDYGRLLRTFDLRSKGRKSVNNGEGSAKRLSEDPGDEGPLAKRPKVS